MNKYLFFRTDRIGDFLLSAVLLRSIKRNDKSSHITIVASEKNYDYIKNISFIDKTILYPKSTLKKFFFFLNIFKDDFYCCASLDGKKKSIYACLLVKARCKIIFTTKYIYQFFLRLITKNVLYSIDFSTKIAEIQFILKILNFNFKETDLNIFDNEQIKSLREKSIIKSINIRNYIILHFDEKWIQELYISKYDTIEPNVSQLELFFNNIVKSSSKNLVVTTGNIKLNILQKIKENYENVSKNVFKKKIGDNGIYIIENLDFFELKELIFSCFIFISCHGAPTHVASALNKKIIDIFNKNDEKWYKKWNSHLRNYDYLYREKFEFLSEKILKKL